MPTLANDPEGPCFPLPHLLAAFTFLLLNTCSPTLREVPEEVVSIRLLHSLLVTKLPFDVYAIELMLAVGYSETYATEQAIVSVLVILGYCCRMRPNFEKKRRLPALMGGKRKRDLLIESRPYGDGGQQGLDVIEEFEDEEGDRGNEFYHEEANTLKQVPKSKLKPLHRD